MNPALPRLLCMLLASPFFCIFSEVRADRRAEIDSQLKEFKAHPARVMNRIPVKRDSHTGFPLLRVPQRFSREAIANGAFVLQKDSVRQSFCKKTHGRRQCLDQEATLKSDYLDNDLAENLTDNGPQLLRSPQAMEVAQLTQAVLAEAPWSDSYWPTYQGVLGNRYADTGFPQSSDWKANQKYISEDSLDFWSIFSSQDLPAVDRLSPSEKYDLLVGDGQGALTAANWATGAHYYDEYGKVATWMGICHGWAPASYMFGRPQHSVTLLAADNRTQLVFYPSDIKGLASLLWARSKTTTRFIGARCTETDPPKDAVGRIRSQKCFDTNPGTWHLAVVNQLGVAKRSMVIDAIYDYEVWNQPLSGYQYTYFNPQTGQAVSSLQEATVSMQEFSDDKFSAYRSKKAVSFVGIAMDLTYMEETKPSHAPFDSHADDESHTVRYLYDLELNERGEIVGGEWYENAHPDFIWTPAPGTTAGTLSDALATDDWKGAGMIPDNWHEAALAKSRASGSPLFKIVDLLVTLSRI